MDSICPYSSLGGSLRWASKSPLNFAFDRLVLREATQVLYFNGLWLQALFFQNADSGLSLDICYAISLNAQHDISNNI
jgi:hypothetical protein